MIFQLGLQNFNAKPNLLNMCVRYDCNVYVAVLQVQYTMLFGFFVHHAFIAFTSRALLYVDWCLGVS